jgi:hypothetical protein
LPDLAEPEGLWEELCEDVRDDEGYSEEDHHDRGPLARA